METRRIHILLRDNLFSNDGSQVRLMTDEQATAANATQVPGNPWRWVLMDTRAFEMVNPPTEEVIVMKAPGTAVAKDADRRERVLAHLQTGGYVACKAFDFEERRWLECTLRKGKDEQHAQAEDEEGLAWDATAEELLDPKQFKAFEFLTATNRTAN